MVRAAYPLAPSDFFEYMAIVYIILKCSKISDKKNINVWKSPGLCIRIWSQATSYERKHISRYYLCNTSIRHAKAVPSEETSDAAVKAAFMRCFKGFLREINNKRFSGRPRCWNCREVDHQRINCLTYRNTRISQFWWAQASFQP